MLISSAQNPITLERLVMKKTFFTFVAVMIFALRFDAAGHAAVLDPSRTAEFQAVINQFMSQVYKGYFGRSCVSVRPELEAERSGSFKDTHYDNTPAGFRLSTDTLIDPKGMRKAQLAYLEKQGFLESAPNANGGLDYSMTWKGYAQSNGNGCLFIHGSRRKTVVSRIEDKTAENGASIHEVTARVLLDDIAPWAQGGEFNRLFPQHAAILQKDDLDPLVFDMTRGKAGMEILKTRRGTYHPPSAVKSRVMAKTADTISADQVRAAVESYVQTTLNATAAHKLCMKLPARNEVDQLNLANSGKHTSSDALFASFDIFNIPDRPRTELANKLRGTTWLRRMESLGLAKSKTLDNTEFGGAAALGGTRFEITGKVAERFSPELGNCYPLNTYQVDAIISFEQIVPPADYGGVVARISVRPVDDYAKRIISTFGHFSRVAAVGAPLTGTMKVNNGSLQVTHARVQLPKFQPGNTEPMVAARPQGADQAAARDAGIEVHSVRVYEGVVPGEKRPSAFKSHPEGTVTINIFPTPKPMGLFLTANEPVHWIIDLKDGARLARIITSSNNPQRVTFANSPGVSVARTSYTGQEERNPTAAERAFGIKPTTNSYQYKATSFDVGPP